MVSDNDSDVIGSKADKTVTAAAKTDKLSCAYQTGVNARIINFYDIDATSSERVNLGQHSGNI